MESAVVLQLLDLLRRLRHPAVIAGGIAHLALAAGLCAVPLFSGLGFERAFATGLLTGASAPLLGWALTRPDPDAPGWGESWAFGLAIHALWLLPTVIAGWLVDHIGPSCNPEAGLTYIALLPGAGAAYGLGLGQWARSALGRRGAWAVPAFAAVHLGVALVVLYVHPQIRAFDPLLGHWPGSLYDEALRPSSALVAHRAFTVLLGAAIVALGAAIRPPTSTAPRRLGAALGFIAATGGALTLYADRDALGFGTGYAQVDAALGYGVETEHFVVHLPSGTTRELARRIAEDHEFWYDRLAPFFARPPTRRIDSYYYANADQKGQLMGAAKTKIARPWAGEMHLHDVRYPHPSLPHEMAHILAAEWAPGPLNVPARFGVWPQIGIVEGVAVAAHWPVDHANIHEKARAMMALGLLPDLRTTLSWTGFWKQPPSRAYAAAGSFIRWLRDERGPLVLAELYRTGSVSAALGQSVEEAVTDWETFIAAQPADASLVAWAEARYHRPSIFARACPHETAQLGRTARERLNGGRLDEAEPIVERLLELYPDPAWARSVAQAAAKAGDLDRARAWLDRSKTVGEADRKTRREGLDLEASLAWRSNDLETARTHLERAAGLAVNYEDERFAAARLRAASLTATVAITVLGYLEGDPGGEAGLARIMLQTAREPLIDYLVARRLESAGEPALAEARTRRALAGHLPGALFSEAQLMLARQLLDQGRPQEAETVLRSLVETAERPAVRARAEEWRDRARFTRRWSKGPASAKSTEES